MRKILVSLFIVTFLFLLSSFFSSTYAACGDMSQYAKTYSEASGTCQASTGLGFNTAGGSWVCGPVACPGASSPSPHGNNCIFSQSDGRCFAGYNNTTYGGFNPDGTNEPGCTYNPADNGTPITCPTSLIVKVKVQSSSGTPLANVPVQVYNNGWASAPTSGSDGMIAITSWSSNHMKIWGTNSSSYTFDHTSSNPYDFQVNNPYGQGCNEQTPCVLVATAAGGGGASPSPSVSPTQHATKINLAISLMGIGVKGNLSPKHPTRTVHIQVYKKGDDPKQPNITPVADITNANVTFDSNSGYFLNPSLSLGNLPTGDYQILVKTPGYLRREIEDNQNNSTFTLTLDQTTTLPSVPLIAGDTAPLYNNMQASDFYAIVDCYKDKATGSSCAAGNTITDLDDNGVIDGVDLNVWLLGMQALLQKDFNTDGSGDGITGN